MPSGTVWLWGGEGAAGPPPHPFWGSLQVCCSVRGWAVRQQLSTQLLVPEQAISISVSWVWKGRFGGCGGAGVEQVCPLLPFAHSKISWGSLPHAVLSGPEQAL